MKREQLDKLGLNKAQTDAVMAENGRDIEAAKSTAIAAAAAAADAAAAENNALRVGLELRIAQLGDELAAAKAAATDAVRAASEEKLRCDNILAQEKNRQTEAAEALRASLRQELKREAALASAFAAVNFSSQLARSAAIQEFQQTEPALSDEGEFAGFDGFIAGLRTRDPEAFLPESRKSGSLPVFSVSVAADSSGIPDSPRLKYLR